MADTDTEKEKHCRWSHLKNSSSSSSCEGSGDEGYHSASEIPSPPLLALAGLFATRVAVMSMVVRLGKPWDVAPPALGLPPLFTSREVLGRAMWRVRRGMRDTPKCLEEEDKCRKDQLLGYTNDEQCNCQVSAAAEEEEEEEEEEQEEEEDRKHDHDEEDDISYLKQRIYQLERGLPPVPKNGERVAFIGLLNKQKEKDLLPNQLEDAVGPYTSGESSGEDECLSSESIVLTSPTAGSVHSHNTLRKRGKADIDPDSMVLPQDFYAKAEEVGVWLSRPHKTCNGANKVRARSKDIAQESSVSWHDQMYKRPPGGQRKAWPIESNVHDQVGDVQGEVISENSKGEVISEYSNGVILHEDPQDQNEYTKEKVEMPFDKGNAKPLLYRPPDDQSLHFGNPLFWPVGLAVKAVGFQLRLVLQTLIFALSVFSWFNSFATNRVRDTLQAKDRATEVVSHQISMISNMPPKVRESGTIVVKRAAWGCLAATYVCILLSMLLFPALLLDYAFVGKFVEEPVSIREPLHFDYTQSHPSASVLLQPTRSAGGKSGRYENMRAIPVSHRVQITVILTLPESDYNRNLGMFQLTSELIGKDVQILRTSSRPCMLRFHSTPIRMVKTLLVSLPSLVGMFSESQTLVIPLMEFEEQAIPTCTVKILLQPKAGMPRGQGIPELYSAEIRIESHLPWLKDVMRRWKWTFYIWTGFVVYIFEVILLLCCCRQALMPKTWVSRSEQASNQNTGGENLSSEDVSEGITEENKLQNCYSERMQIPWNERIPKAMPYIPDAGCTSTEGPYSSRTH